MIIIRFCPKLLSSCGQITKQLDFVEGKKIAEYIQDSMFVDTGRVIISGKAVQDRDVVIKDGDEIIIAPDIAFDPVTWGTFWAFVLNTLATIVISLAVSYGLSLLTGRKPSRSTVGSGIDEGSQTYGWDGIRTTQEIGTPVPVVYGEHMVGGNIINQYLSVDGDKHYLNVLLSLCEGEIESIESVRINDNPKDNFDGITYTERMGTNAQTVIPNFQDLHDVNTVSVNLTQGNAHTYTTTATDVEGFDINLTLPAGLYQANNDGSISAWDVTYKVEYKIHTDSVWIDLGEATISYVSRTALYRIFSKRGITAGQYDIRVTRTSDDGSLSPVKTGDLTWSSLDEIRTDDLAYPNTALIGIQALATDQLNGTTPNITTIIKGRKISVPAIIDADDEPISWENYYYDSDEEKYRLLSNGNILEWDGTTFRSEWSANPVWCLYDLLTNERFGLGEFIDSTMIDLQSFIAMSQYCEHKLSDGNGGYEKRFRLDMVLDSSTRALDAVVQIAQVFRGLVFYAGGTIKVKIDKQDTPVQLFGMGNIVQGSFTQSWASIKERFNVIEVQYLDKNKLYVQEKVAVVDDAALAAGDALRKQQLRVFSTQPRQAYREARYMLYKNKYLTRSISFRAGIDAICCEAGDIINVCHDVPQWGYSGNLSLVTSTTIVKLDQNVTIETGKIYKLMLRLAGDVIEERTVTTGASTTDTITVDTAFSVLPADGDIYAFGESSIETKPFRIQEIKVNADHTAEIVALEYNESIYDDTAPPNPTDSYSALTFEIPEVTNLALSESVVIAEDGTIQRGIDIWFSRPIAINTGSMYAHARVYISDNAGVSWVQSGETYGTYFQIKSGIVVGRTYRVAVVSVGANGQAIAISNAPYGNITIEEVPVAPADVTGFDHSWGDILTLVWTGNTEANIAGYEVRDQDSNWGVDGEHLIFRGLATTKVLYPTTRTVGTFYIRAFNASRVYSEASASLTPSLSAPAAPTGLTADVLFNVAKTYWTDTGGSNNLYYEVYKSYTNAWAGEESLVSRVSGRSADLLARPYYSGQAQSGSTTTLVDSALIGLGDDYLVGSKIRISGGAGIGQEAIITDFVDATGSITFSTQAVAIDSTSKYVIVDRVYIKVRGVDQYGAGSLSNSLLVEFEGLTEDAFDDNSITARKIYVACLSSLSANVGCLNAGIIQGVQVQTASGGARTVFSGTEFRSYDAACNVMFEVKDGCVQAKTLKLVDPACDCCYSYLSSGQWYFHDELNNSTPYVKRLCQGEANTGDTVVLCGWRAAPNVQVGIKSLLSYNSAYSVNCQQWCVYHDVPVWFCTSPTCYGYCFGVHAALVRSAGAYAECILDVAEGTNIYTSINNDAVCTTIRSRFNFWCFNASVSSCYKYGEYCYEIRYKCCVAGCAWTCCSYLYCQPHATSGELTSCYYACNVITFPSAGCWQLVQCAVSTTWQATTISGVSLCCCCRPFSAISNVLGYGFSFSGGGDYPPPEECQASQVCCSGFGGSNPSNVYCNYVCYSWCTRNIIPYHDMEACGRSHSYGCEFAESHYSTWFTGTSSGSHDVTCSGTTCYAFASGFNACNFTYMYNCALMCAYLRDGASLSGTLCSCISAGYLVQCYCQQASTCTNCSTRLYSRQDYSSAQTVLDPAGVLNYIAIGYY